MEKTNAEIFAQILDDTQKSQHEPKKYRICSNCLCDIERENYEEHMQLAHGYTTLHITGVDHE